MDFHGQSVTFLCWCLRHVKRVRSRLTARPHQTSFLGAAGHVGWARSSDQREQATLRPFASLWPACVTHRRVLGTEHGTTRPGDLTCLRRNMMSTPDDGLDGPKRSWPSQPSGRRQIKRSLTELASPGKLHRRPHLYRQQGSQSEEKDKPPLSPAILAAQGRHSLDIPPSTTTTTPFMSPNPSRRASILGPGGERNGESREKREKMGIKTQLAQEKASIRTE